jgi:hypothetical protein
VEAVAVGLEHTLERLSVLVPLVVEELRPAHVVAYVAAVPAQEEFTDDAAETEPVDGVVEPLDEGDHVLGLRPAEYHRDRTVELAVLQRRVRLVLRLHHAARVRVHDARKADDGCVRPVGGGVRVPEVRVELGRERPDEFRLGLDVRLRLGQLPLAHPDVLEQEDIAGGESVNRRERLLDTGVGNEVHLPSQVVGQDGRVFSSETNVAFPGRPW